MNERRWTAADFEYDLPEELIAQAPPAVRGDSRLMVITRALDAPHGVSMSGRGTGAPDEASALGRDPDVPDEASALGRDPAVPDEASALGRDPDVPDEASALGRDPDVPDEASALGRGTAAPLLHAPLRDACFADLATLIPAGDLLVVNSTRVRHARLLGRRPGGGPAEVLLIHPSTADSWIAMGSPGRAMQPGQRIALSDTISIETIAVLDDGTRQVRFVGATAATAMAQFGRVPLPPYIARDPGPDDTARYQTVYADRTGSVAAPTAGLHFTDALLAALRDHGVAVAALDLEVGPGTFRPMADGDVLAHPMHAEHFEIPGALAAEIAACRARAGRVWAVGTTVVRALESAVAGDGTVPACAGATSLMISPGFRFRVVDRLITNFHLPRSTLLMLVAAFAGHATTMAAYQHAIRERYRFYSYGDAMAII